MQWSRDALGVLLGVAELECAWGWVVPRMPSMSCCRAFSVYCPCGLSHPVLPTVPKIAEDLLKNCEVFHICLRVIKLFWEGLS